MHSNAKETFPHVHLFDRILLPGPLFSSLPEKKVESGPAEGYVLGVTYDAVGCVLNRAIGLYVADYPV